MSAETPAAAAPATQSGGSQAIPAIPAIPSSGQSIMPPASQNREAEELLKQTDALKEQVNERERQAKAQDAETQKMKAELEYYRKKAAEEAEQYKKAQEPR